MAKKEVPADAASFGNEARGFDWQVMLWDESAPRREKIRRAVKRAGAEPLEPSRERQPRLLAMCIAAVVGMGEPPSHDALQVVRELREDELKVVACGDGAGSWPIRHRCLPLHAGAVRVLDSAGVEFESELEAALREIWHAESEQRHEAQHVRTVMRSLGMVGESPAMLEVFRTAMRFSALSDLPTLITGETGTGKEGLARAIHRLDAKRSRGPFVPVNCGAINPTLAESEFFGHRRGAFTGADRDRKGLIRSADGGVLFLDEIGELDAALQTKLLRVLQEGRVTGVGEDAEAPVSARVVAATNCDLEQQVHERRFRADLFHRLNVLSLKVPPLRDRPDDVPALTSHFLEKYQTLRAGETLQASAEFVEALQQLTLPGNVRQLENIVRQALVRKAPGAPLRLSDLPADVWEQLCESPTTPAVTSDVEPMVSYVVGLLEANGWNLSRSLDHCERHVLEAAMEHTHGNQSQTARLLGITPRSVYSKLRKHRLRT